MASSQDRSGFSDGSTPTLSVEEIAGLVGGRIEGDGGIRVSGVAPLDQAGPQELGFLAQRRYLRFLPQSKALAVLVSEALAAEAREIPCRIVVKEAHAALPPLLGALYPPEEAEPGIHSTAVLGKGVELGEKVTIGPYAVLEEGVKVGDGTRIGPHVVVGKGSVIGTDSTLHPQVVLYPGTEVGSRVILHAGARLGVEGFGFVPVGQEHRKVPQVGACVVEDDVEIQANACIDRGSIGRTVIGKGTKLDNLVHIGHNVQVGKGTLIIAQVGIAGSVLIGDRTILGGQAGISGHLEIGDGARIGAQAGVIGDVPAGETFSGYPARNHREYLRAMGMAFKLPETHRRIKELEARIAALEKVGEE